MARRDLTEKQFHEACERYGFKRRHFMGYYDVGGVDVSTWNAGPTYREKLAYLIRESEKARR